MNTQPARTSNFQRVILIGSAFCNAYFWLQFLLYSTGSYSVLTGVFTELLTIPCLIGLAIGFVMLLLYLCTGWLERRWRIAGWILVLSSVLLVVAAFHI
jgi:hypothetical protein